MGRRQLLQYITSEEHLSAPVACRFFTQNIGHHGFNESNVPPTEAQVSEHLVPGWGWCLALMEPLGGGAWGGAGSEVNILTYLPVYFASCSG